MRSVVDRLTEAVLRVRHERRRAVRIWLTEDDWKRLLSELRLDPTRVRWRRFMGVPISLCLPPQQSRVVDGAGVASRI